MRNILDLSPARIFLHDHLSLNLTLLSQNFSILFHMIFPMTDFNTDEIIEQHVSYRNNFNHKGDLPRGKNIKNNDAVPSFSDLPLITSDVQRSNTSH